MADLQQFLDEHLKRVRLQKLSDGEEALEYDIFSEIAENLIAARMEEGLTQGELAKRCGISQANISKFETGSSHPSLATLKRIADGLGRRLSVTFEDVSFEGEE